MNNGKKFILRRQFRYALLLIVHCSLLIVNWSCYSFTGSSVPPHLKTVAVPLFEDQSGFGEANVREKITKKMIDLFISDNSLSVAERNVADAIIEGSVMTISDVPAVVAAGEQVRTRKLTVTVRASFTDLKLRKKLWEKDFSQWGNYAQGSQSRTVALDEAVNKIAEDILIETVSGW